MRRIYPHSRAVLNSYAEVLFIQQSPLIGFILMLVSFLNPSVGVGGLVSLTSAYLFARFIGMGKVFLETGFYTYNALLVGLSVGYLFKITPLTLTFTAVAGVLTLVFSVMLYSVFSYYLRLPILSVPFVVISSMLYLSASGYANLFAGSFYTHFNIYELEIYTPLWLAGYFKSLGAILFSPTVLAGILFTILILIFSRIMLFLAITGYYTGTLLEGMMLGSFEKAFLDVNNFNFILVAMAIGGVFLIPSLKSYVMSVVGVIISTVVLSSVKSFWSIYGIPAFTLPFNFTSLSMLYVLGLVNFPMIARYIRKTPEGTLDYYLTYIKRFRGTERGIHLPFAGEWTVWQGFDDEWTHKGIWKYAYDFIITDEGGKSFSNSGENLEDYYAFRKPVLSPVRGRVVRVVSDLPDNPIGKVDKENNWGNLVVIYDERGFYVELSHFSQSSIRVKEGDWVEIGTLLGLCGNSGYSPQPHIHIQVQSMPEPNSPTLPFSFVDYISDGKFFSNFLPKKGSRLSPAYTSKHLSNRLAFAIGNEFVYEAWEEDAKVGELMFKVNMDVDGSFFFESEKGKLYFGKHEGTFYFYRFEGKDPYLKLLFLAAPRIPLVEKEGVEWEDYVPLNVSLNPYKRAAILFFSSFNHRVFSTEYRGKIYEGGKSLRGKILPPLVGEEIPTEVEIDNTLGFKRVRVGRLELKLKETFIGGMDDA